MRLSSFVLTVVPLDQVGVDHCLIAESGQLAGLSCPLQRAAENEGLTPKQVHDVAPGWQIFRDGCPGGEAPERVGARVDRVIAQSRAVDGDIALFAHGHALRVLAARWIGLPAGGGQHFLLDTGTLCVLGYYREIPAVRIWNGPLIG